ncbi:MAG TPA: hypothetical protein PKD83_10040 [Ignavibacteria bacterium]|nr:hypothetical protein [Ignavibacteria bacterium]
MSELKLCSKCNSNLEKGFFYVRNNSDPSFFNYVVWVGGEKNEISTFMGTKASATQFPVTPYKCEKCGHIEFYSDDPGKWRH